MREIEVKILEINREAAIEKLLSLGAVRTFDGEIHALYYDTPRQELRARDVTLRLRKEGAKAVLTVKRDIARDIADEQAKVREEEDVTVSGFDAMRIILESLGFSVWLEMQKHRTSYELDGLHFEFDRYHDSYAYIPEFLEIEGPSVGIIRRYASLLGHRADDCLPWDAVQLASYYADRRTADSG